MGEPGWGAAGRCQLGFVLAGEQTAPIKVLHLSAPMLSATCTLTLPGHDAARVPEKAQDTGHSSPAIPGRDPVPLSCSQPVGSALCSARRWPWRHRGQGPSHRGASGLDAVPAGQI